jgi:hypothetical protein
VKRLLFAIATTMAAMIGPAHGQLKVNPNQAAILRWYTANQTTSFSVGNQPARSWEPSRQIAPTALPSTAPTFG